MEAETKTPNEPEFQVHVHVHIPYTQTRAQTRNARARGGRSRKRKRKPTSNLNLNTTDNPGAWDLAKLPQWNMNLPLATTMLKHSKRAHVPLSMIQMQMPPGWQAAT
jgi:hypothetical protein